MRRNIGNISVLNREGESVDITQATFVQDLMLVRTIPLRAPSIIIAPPHLFQ